MDVEQPPEVSRDGLCTGTRLPVRERIRTDFADICAKCGLARSWLRRRVMRPIDLAAATYVNMPFSNERMHDASKFVCHSDTHSPLPGTGLLFGLLPKNCSEPIIRYHSLARICFQSSLTVWETTNAPDPFSVSDGPSRGGQRWCEIWSLPRNNAYCRFSNTSPRAIAMTLLPPKPRQVAGLIYDA